MGNYNALLEQTEKVSETLSNRKEGEEERVQIRV